MAGSIKQLRENIKYIQKAMNSLTAAERNDVFRADYQDFNNSLQEMSRFLEEFERIGELPLRPDDRDLFKQTGEEACEHVFREEFLLLQSDNKLNTAKGRLMHKAIKNLEMEVNDFYQAFQKKSNVNEVETRMCNLNRGREGRLMEHSALIQKISIKSRITDVAEQKNDVNGMMKLLKSTKSVFLKNSNYFTDLENSLSALKNFTDNLPQGQKKLNDEQTKTLTELYNNAYKAADAYINRPNRPGVPVARGSRMNMALRLREAMRTGAAAHMALDMRKQDAQKQAAAEAAKNNKEPQKKDNKEPQKQPAANVKNKNEKIQRTNSMKAKEVKNDFKAAPISRQRTMGH